MTIQTAREFAITAHGDQMYGEHPYVYHLDAVVEILKSFTESENIKKGWKGWNFNGSLLQLLYDAGYLHDVIEDTNVTWNDVQETFGNVNSQLWKIVTLVTDPDGKNRAERKQRLYQNFVDACDTNDNYTALVLFSAIVKCADRIANHGQTITENNHKKMTMYVQEFPQFIAVFGQQVWDTDLVHTLFSQYNVMQALLSNDIR